MRGTAWNDDGAVAADRFAFSITQSLNEALLFRFGGFKEIGQFPSCERESLPRVQLPSPAYFLRRPHHFFF